MKTSEKVYWILFVLFILSQVSVALWSYHYGKNGGELIARKKEIEKEKAVLMTCPREVVLEEENSCSIYDYSVNAYVGAGKINGGCAPWLLNYLGKYQKLKVSD